MHLKPYYLSQPYYTDSDITSILPSIFAEGHGVKKCEIWDFTRPGLETEQHIGHLKHIYISYS